MRPRAGNNGLKKLKKQMSIYDDRRRRTKSFSIRLAATICRIQQNRILYTKGRLLFIQCFAFETKFKLQNPALDIFIMKKLQFLFNWWPFGRLPRLPERTSLEKAQK